MKPADNSRDATSPGSEKGGTLPFDALRRVHDDQAVFTLWLAGAAWNQYQEDMQKARYYAEKARAIGTDVERFNQALDEILK